VKQAIFYGHNRHECPLTAAAKVWFLGVDWFNPSIAHQHYRSSDTIFENLTGLRAQYVPNGRA